MRRLIIIGIVLSMWPAVASTQTARNTREAATDNRQIVAGRAQLQRDSRELSEFEGLVRSLEDARQDRMAKRYRDANALIRVAMKREIEQARKKASQSKGEVRQSRREASGERMEANANGNARDFAQAIDDRRDLRDDRRDWRARAEVLRDMERVASQASALDDEIAPGKRDALARNDGLAHEFLSLMREDWARTQSELGEDRAERREDRRERRTDSRDQANAR
jgi:hypothetical protein